MLVEKIVSYYEKEHIPASEQFDFLVVDGRCLIMNEKMNGGISLGTGCRGIYFVELGNETLAAFLYWLNKVPAAQLRMGPSVLEHYVPWQVTKVQQFIELNERLRKIARVEKP